MDGMRILSQEVGALEARLTGLQPFALHEPMVPAAAPAPAAMAAIERRLRRDRDEILARIGAFRGWLASPGFDSQADAAQAKFSVLRMRSNAMLSDYEIFAAALTQRSEHSNGVWLAGLDVAATDALTLDRGYFEPPPLLCYLDRGFGAAIRRARTRLPGGKLNPVAVIRIPRERMVGSGIASSLVHEAGHQGAALLGLVDSLRFTLAGLARGDGADGLAWTLWGRWISEIVADFWSVARLGMASVLGMMAVVSLPRAFVFRVSAVDPHPTPWIRVAMCCAMGQMLYPHADWRRLASAWEELYPLEELSPSQEEAFTQLGRTLSAFVTLLVEHRPRALQGVSLGEALRCSEVEPDRLRYFYRSGLAPTARTALTLRPVAGFALAAQARLDQVLEPAGETRLIAALLRSWALRRTWQAA
jgi:hypothetical protein